MVETVLVDDLSCVLAQSLTRAIAKDLPEQISQHENTWSKARRDLRDTQTHQCNRADSRPFGHLQVPDDDAGIDGKGQVGYSRDP